MSNTIELDGISLYSGDLITIGSNNGNYWYVEDSPNGNQVITSNSKQPTHKKSVFLVEVVENSKISKLKLRVNPYDGYNYLRSFTNNEFGIITTTESESQSSDFFVKRLNRNNTMMLIDNNNRYFGRKEYLYWKRNIIVSEVSSRQGESCIFSVMKRGVQAKEIVRKIDFEYNNAIKIVSDYIMVNTQTLVNLSNFQQVKTFKFAEKFNTQKIFEWDHKFLISSDTKFKVEIPLIGKSKEIIKMTCEFAKRGLENETNVTTIELTKDLLVPARSMITGNVFIRVGEINVNFISTIFRYLNDNLGREKEYVYQVEGVYRGINIFESIVKFEPILKIDNNQYNNQKILYEETQEENFTETEALDWF